MRTCSHYDKSPWDAKVSVTRTRLFGNEITISGQKFSENEGKR